MTDLIRSDPPLGSLAGFSSLIVLTGLLGLFVVLSIVGFLAEPLLGPAYEMPQIWTAVWMGMVFFLLAAILEVYRRQYVPDELIHKKRRPKIVYRRAIR